MTGTERITLAGRELWAYVVDLEGGLRVQFALDDWELLGLYRGQRVGVRRAGSQAVEKLFLAEVMPLPPIVWVVFANRVRAAG
jgi:hypothetical protein